MEQFAYIPFVPDKKTVMRRMGAQKAQLPDELESNIEALINEAQSVFRVKGKALTIPMRLLGDGVLEIGGEPVSSALLAKLMRDSKSAYLMCASIPERDVLKISAAISGGEGLKALVFDAYASEFVDGALDIIMSRKNETLRRTGQKLTKHRFSAGYGDLDIKYQKLFYDMLDMRTLDVVLNDKYLLSPEKSVIAIAGVE